ncbi:hypothetical protein M3Y94_00653700 [Aphelenchoides besseyi]|nr:hypothetical protein M3Y94_00653700 [Aphelenchoides besseyi]KAI6231164.1 Methylthioribulose-1-phosphate dehydratase [Aphelenchoides besseyi]
MAEYKQKTTADTRSIFKREFDIGKCPHCSYAPKNITARNAKQHLQMLHPSMYRELVAKTGSVAGMDAGEEDSSGPIDSTCSFQSPTKQEDNAQLISELMRQFYTLGWVYGSGGAMCIRNAEGFTFVTPSGVQKDRIKSEDIGMFDPQNQLVVAPAKPNVVSSCVNLFWTIFRTHEKQNPNRPLNAVVHTHSIDANLMASFPFQSYDHVRLSNEEMLKGIADRSTGCQLTNTQTCVIPVIENAPSESCPEFKERIERAMLENPNCSAILVRNHGAFYFGSSWEETKLMAEIFEYLFKLTLEKLRFAPQLADRIFRSK